MSNDKSLALSASSYDLFSFHVSHHKELDYESFKKEFEKNKEDKFFLRDLIETYTKENFKSLPCIVIHDAFDLISSCKKKEQEFYIMKEYDVKLSHLYNKNRKNLNVLVIPFFEEEIAVSFANTMFRSTCLDVELWQDGFLLGD